MKFKSEDSMDSNDAVMKCPHCKKEFYADVDIKVVATVKERKN